MRIRRIRHEDGRRAQELYEEAMNMLEELDGVFAALDGQGARCVAFLHYFDLVLKLCCSPRKSLDAMLTPKSQKLTNSHETLAPSVLMAILRQNSKPWCPLLLPTRLISMDSPIASR